MIACREELNTISTVFLEDTFFSLYSPALLSFTIQFIWSCEACAFSECFPLKSSEYSRVINTTVPHRKSTLVELIKIVTHQVSRILKQTLSNTFRPPSAKRFYVVVISLSYTLVESGSDWREGDCETIGTAILQPVIQL